MADLYLMCGCPGAGKSTFLKNHVKTDSSGMVENIVLPAPKINVNNMEVPNTIDYEITAISDDNLKRQVYHVNMYDGICVVQNINYIPSSFGGVINGY